MIEYRPRGPVPTGWFASAVVGTLVALAVIVGAPFFDPRGAALTVCGLPLVIFVAMSLANVLPKIAPPGDERVRFDVDDDELFVGDRAVRREDVRAVEAAHTERGWRVRVVLGASDEVSVLDELTEEEAVATRDVLREALGSRT